MTESEVRMPELPTENLFRAIYPGVEVRDTEGDGPPILAGHFARFNEWTEIDSFFEGRFMERIAPGAFRDSFAQFTPKILFQHGRDPDLGDKVLGSPATVREDDTGAYYEVPLFRSVPPLIVDGLRAGAYGASFRFSVDEEEVVRKPERSDHNPDGIPERTITKTTTYEAGPVTFPAYAGATAGIRSLTDQFRPHDFQDELTELARERPGELAKRIERALRGTAQTGSAAEHVEPPPPTPPRFRSREEFLAWMSQS
jgi:phage head maturation protease